VVVPALNGELFEKFRHVVSPSSVTLARKHGGFVTKTMTFW